MHPLDNIVRCSQAYLEKHTSRTMARQHWLSLHMAVYIASANYRLDASSLSRMQRLEREGEREYMHNPLLGYLQCMCVCESA